MLLALLSTVNLDLTAQPAERGAPLPLAKAGSRFHFDVIESFDAKYEGDTPGHSGRSGGLSESRPQIALGDPVFRDTQKVGSVTRVEWVRVQGSLTIEFDPEPDIRIAVGDSVWVDLNPAQVPTKTN